MKLILCLFVLVLSVTVYPVTRFQNSELLYIFNLIETDIFNWYRMILVSLMALLIPFFAKEMNQRIFAYVVLLFLSTITSRFPETSLYGTPMHHEGILAILGYLGIYLATKRLGFFKELEKSIDAVVYITAFISLLQIKYGNFLNFPLFKMLLPDVQLSAVNWPIYANMGMSNNLGLFCALLLPYSLIRKKKLQSFLLISLLVASQTRSAWLSVLITTALISRRYLVYALVIAAVLCIPIREDVIGRIKHTVDDIHWPIRDGDLAGRAYIWKRAIPVMKDSILLGKGPGTYLQYIPQFHERGNQIGFQMQAIDRPHNLFINIWESTGLLSLLILAYEFFKIMRNGKDASLKYGVLGYLIASFFTDSVLCVTPYFLIFLGGISGSNNEARRHGEGASRPNLGNRSSNDETTNALLFDYERCS